MSSLITQELRETVDMMEEGKLIPYTKPSLLSVANRIDAEHRRRMEDCRRETKRAFARYLRGVLTDYDRGIKRVRKGDKVEVTMCRDCRWAREVEPVDGWRLVCYVRPIMKHYVRDDGYCDQGERAEVDG